MSSIIDKFEKDGADFITTNLIKLDSTDKIYEENYNYNGTNQTKVDQKRMLQNEVGDDSGKWNLIFNIFSNKGIILFGLELE